MASVRARAAAALVLAALAGPVAAHAQTAPDEEARRQLRVPARAVVILETTLPKTHFFADRIVAKVVLAVNPALTDPESVSVVTDFRPYRLIDVVEPERERRGTRVILTYEFPLECLEPDCLPGTLADPYSMPRQEIHYLDREGEEGLPVTFRWPPLAVQSRLTPREIEQPEFRARVEQPPPVSYRAAPWLAGTLLAVAALAVLASGLIAAYRLRPEEAVAAPLAPAAPERASVVTALGVLERTRSRGVAERRTALDALGRALDAADAPALAARARSLAWSPEPPTPAAMDELGAAVRRELRVAA